MSQGVGTMETETCNNIDLLGLIIIIHYPLPSVSHTALSIKKNRRERSLNPLQRLESQCCLPPARAKSPQIQSTMANHLVHLQVSIPQMALLWDGRVKGGC